MAAPFSCAAPASITPIRAVGPSPTATGSLFCFRVKAEVSETRFRCPQIRQGPPRTWESEPDFPEPVQLPYSQMSLITPMRIDSALVAAG